MPPAFLANHAGNFTTGWVDAVNPQPFLDAGVWPRRTFLTRTSTVTPEIWVIFALAQRKSSRVPASRPGLATQGLEKRSVTNCAESIKKGGKGNHRTIKLKWQYRYLSIRTAISFFLA